MDMMDLIKALMPLGVGGVLAAFIFWFYRQDRLECAKREERMINVVACNARSNEKLAQEINHLGLRLDGIRRPGDLHRD